MQWGARPHVLIFGGGSSHDFGRWFNQADSATLSEGGKASVNYTDSPSAILPALKDVDVLYLSSNQPVPDPALRQGIFQFVGAGKGLLLVHPALWYNWKDWPEYNRALAGGGAPSHDRFGEFEVTVDETSHPIMAGVPASFKISDELYHFQRDPQGSPIEVLASGKSPLTGKTFPVVWTVRNSNARIACITLGHDGKAHEHAAFKSILKNSLAWAAGRP
jgi:type 1 glutamine amidotransferase